VLFVDEKAFTLRRNINHQTNILDTGVAKVPMRFTKVLQVRVWCAVSACNIWPMVSDETKIPSSMFD